MRIATFFHGPDKFIDGGAKLIYKVSGFTGNKKLKMGPEQNFKNTATFWVDLFT
jgi:hypothetical protein